MNANDTPIARNASLDAARGILMMLGVVLHTANIYASHGDWLVWDPQHNGFFDQLIAWIHVFRMPAFFWISGYFCALTFARNGAPGLLRKRIPRLAIPLLATWLTLNVAQVALLAWLRGEPAVAALANGIPLYHLWFLVDLLVYMAVAACLLPHVHRFAGLAAWLARLPVWATLPLFAVATLGLSLAVRATGIAYTTPFGLTSLFRLATYAPFFIAGIFMYSHPPARLAFLRVPGWLIVPALPLAAWVHDFTQGRPFVVAEAALLAEILLTWVSVAAALRLFHDFIHRDGPTTRLLSDVAYSVYLFHHIIVVALGFALLGVPLGPWLKFIIVCTLGLAIPLLIHHGIVRRNRVIRLLFNGK